MYVDGRSLFRDTAQYNPYSLNIVGRVYLSIDDDTR